MMKSKIHRATVTDANLNYVGSVSIDPALMTLADILPNEQVAVLDDHYAGMPTGDDDVGYEFQVSRQRRTHSRVVPFACSDI